METQIRIATLLDREGCFALNEALGYKSTSEAFCQRFEFLSKHPDHVLFVATNSQNEVIAWMHLAKKHLLEDNHYAEIAALIVRDQERSLGIGARLLEIAEEWARKEGFFHIYVRSSIQRERAHQFYLKNHYRHIKTSKVFEKVL